MKKTVEWSAVLLALAVCIGISVARANAPLGRYTVGASTVVDNRTKLTWRLTVDSGTLTTRAQAVSHCSGLGSSWRLPTIAELQSIVDITKSNPAIDTSAFAGTASQFFWSSTVSPKASDLYMGVDFTDGSTTTTYDGSFGGSVRCVR